MENGHFGNLNVFKKLKKFIIKKNIIKINNILYFENIEIYNKYKKKFKKFNTNIDSIHPAFSAVKNNYKINHKKINEYYTEFLKKKILKIYKLNSGLGYFYLISKLKINKKIIKQELLSTILKNKVNLSFLSETVKEKLNKIINKTLWYSKRLDMAIDQADDLEDRILEYCNIYRDTCKKEKLLSINLNRTGGIQPYETIFLNTRNIKLKYKKKLLKNKINQKIKMLSGLELEIRNRDYFVNKNYLNILRLVYIYIFNFIQNHYIENIGQNFRNKKNILYKVNSLLSISFIQSNWKNFELSLLKRSFYGYNINKRIIRGLEINRRVLRKFYLNI